MPGHLSLDPQEEIMAGKDVPWLIGELDRRNYRVLNPLAHVHDGKTRFLLVKDMKSQDGRWCTKDKPLAETIQKDEIAFVCPDELWWEFTF
jgi:hypothetical protein